VHAGSQALLDLCLVHQWGSTQVDHIDARGEQRGERVDGGHLPILLCSLAALLVDVGDHRHGCALDAEPAEQMHLADTQTDHPNS